MASDQTSHLLSVNNQMHACGCLCVLITAFVAFLSSFALVFYSLGNIREQELATYQDSIGAWNDTFAEFNDLSISVSLPEVNHVPVGPFRQIKHEPLKTSWKEKEDRDRFATYDVLYYSLSQTNLITELGLANLEHFEAEDPPKSNFLFTIKDTNDPGASQISIQFPQRIPLIRQEIHHQIVYQKPCERINGYFDMALGACVVYERLSHVCLQIERHGQDDLKRWTLKQPDVQSRLALNKLIGCGCFDEDNKVALYSKIHLDAKRGEGIQHALKSIDQSLEVTFTIRHEKDPMFVAKHVSKNTFALDFPSHDLKVLGILGMLISVLIAMRPILVLVRIWNLPGYKKPGFFKASFKKNQDRYDPKLKRRVRRAKQYASYYEDVLESANTSYEDVEASSFNSISQNQRRNKVQHGEGSPEAISSDGRADSSRFRPMELNQIRVNSLFDKSETLESHEHTGVDNFQHSRDNQLLGQEQQECQDAIRFENVRISQSHRQTNEDKSSRSNFLDGIEMKKL